MNTYNARKMNEASVRAEILDPLVRNLGYVFGTDNDVMREHEFRYPKIQLGRKGKNDPDLIGRPDYICSVRGVTTWVLEAKAEGQSLGEETDAQAYTYAAHREIRARYYCLSDGIRFLIYDTYGQANSPPVLDVRLDEGDGTFNAIKAFLGPTELTSARKSEVAQIGLVAPNFDIISGKAFFQNVEFEVHAPDYVKSAVRGQVQEQLNLLRGTIYPIDSGTFRESDGNLVLEVNLGGHSNADLAFQETLGISTLRFETLGTHISTNPNIPTIMQTVQRASLQPGDVIQSSRVAAQRVSFGINFTIIVDASLYREGNKVLGTFRYLSSAPIQAVGINALIEASITGNLEIEI